MNIVPCRYHPERKMDMSTLKRVPGYSDYWVDEDYNAFRYIGNMAYPQLILLTWYNDRYVMMRPDGGSKHKSGLVMVTRAELKRTFEPQPVIKSIPQKDYITMNQMRCKEPLTRERAINFILQNFPEIQIHLMPNAQGKYETGLGMVERGMIVCEECGRIQAIEFKICNNCNQYITQ